jgi:phosphoserine phosphatase
MCRRARCGLRAARGPLALQRDCRVDRVPAGGLTDARFRRVVCGSRLGLGQRNRYSRLMKSLSVCAVWPLLLCMLSLAHAEEPDDTVILQRIFRTREAILKANSGAQPANRAVFIAAWDFDGTILKGDWSEGLKEHGRAYRGQVAIENGFSSLYPRESGFDRFWTDYTNMDTRIGHWLAYPFIPQMLRGAREEDVSRLSHDYFSSTLSNYLMASSVKIIRALEGGGVQCHIISASADLFVKGAAESLGLPAGHIHGIEVRARDDRLTEELIYPVTWSFGKLQRLKQIAKEAEEGPGNPKVFVLAGFGDSYGTDGPFLKFIATQRLPAGEPLAVFYGEGAEPAEYKGLFLQARHTATISETPLK